MKRQMNASTEGNSGEDVRSCEEKKTIRDGGSCNDVTSECIT